MKWLAEELNDNDILNDQQYADVTEVNLLNEEERAEIMVKALLNWIKQDGKKLKIFEDILKKKPQKFRALTAKLNNGKSCAHVHVSCMSNLLCVQPPACTTSCVSNLLCVQPPVCSTSCVSNLLCVQPPVCPTSCLLQLISFF